MTLRAELDAIEARVEAMSKVYPSRSVMRRLSIQTPAATHADMAIAFDDRKRLVQGLRLAVDALTVMSRNRVYGASAREALAALDALGEEAT